MKLWLLMLLVWPVAGFGTTVEYAEVAKLKAYEAQLEDTILEVRMLYRDDAVFLAAFQKAQTQWEQYCAAALEARFPAKDKQEVYGSAYPIAYAAVKQGLIKVRIAELSIWTSGIDEGDVAKGSVKFKRELDELRKQKKG